jgi:hypothetical protein
MVHSLDELTQGGNEECVWIYLRWKQTLFPNICSTKPIINFACPNAGEWGGGGGDHLLESNGELTARKTAERWLATIDLLNMRTVTCGVVRFIIVVIIILIISMRYCTFRTTVTKWTPIK